MRATVEPRTTGGRAAIISFHSGEDRRVKAAFRAGLDAGIYSLVETEGARSRVRDRCLAWIIHQGSSQKRKDALKGMMNTGFADPAFPFGASIT